MIILAWKQGITGTAFANIWFDLVCKMEASGDAVSLWLRTAELNTNMLLIIM